MTFGHFFKDFGAIWEHFWSLGAQFCQGPDASKSVATVSALFGTTAQQILIFLSALPVPMLRQVFLRLQKYASYRVLATFQEK